MEKTILFHWTDYSSHSAFFFFILLVFLNLHVINELLWGALKSTAPQPRCQGNLGEKFTSFPIKLALEANHFFISFE